MSQSQRLSLSLFLLRLGVFVVMFMWTIDKFVNPKHASLVFQKFYLFDGLSHELAYAVGGLQIVLVLGFLAGAYKKWTYGLIMILHTVSTLSTWQMYLDPWAPRNLLFFAAWPMLAATIALFLLRDDDTLLSFHKPEKRH
ncbi:MAG: hypothetical protein AAF202_12820 [Pseudomonadota bacterium]